MSRYVYPRLPFSIARRRITEIDEAKSRGGLLGVRALSSLEHPRAAPIPTGGRVANPARIAEVRSAVRQALVPWSAQARIPPNQVAKFDAELGRALHERLAIIPADAAHAETWNFLTLIVLPDVAVLRFPDMPEERLLGTNRNVLRRTWLRQEVLGDLLRSSDHPLGEDELVGLFERTALARNRALVRRLATAVLDYQGDSARSVWARDLYKRVTFATGPRLLDALSDEELDDLIRGTEVSTARREQPPASVTSVVPLVSIPPRSPEGAAPANQTMPPKSQGPPIPRTATLTDASPAARFQRAMVELYLRAKRELGYNATYLVRMLGNEGGVSTARRLVMSGHASEGFDYLWERHRLDLSVEALVAQEEFASLFDPEVVSFARKRLRDYGWPQ